MATLFGSDVVRRLSARAGLEAGGMFAESGGKRGDLMRAKMKYCVLSTVPQKKTFCNSSKHHKPSCECDCELTVPDKERQPYLIRSASHAKDRYL